MGLNDKLDGQCGHGEQNDGHQTRLTLNKEMKSHACLHRISRELPRLHIWSKLCHMEEGTKAKKTIFVGNIADDVDEAVLLETFNAFGDILDVQIPPAANNPNQQTEEHHKGYGFVTFSSPADAQDAIDNMDLNELKGKVLRVNLARPSAKISTQGMGNRAIWESEEWLQQHAKPLGKSGGAALRAQAGSGSAPAPDESENKDDADDDNAMAE